MRVDDQSKMTCVLSNVIEELYHSLKTRLASYRDTLFQRQSIIVPDLFLKSYLQVRLAREPSQVAIGLEILVPEQAIKEYESSVLPQQVFVFGFSYLPEPLHHFFVKLSREISVTYFVLSPCMMFWGDICSDSEAQKEQAAFQEKVASKKGQDAFCDLLYDRTILLANCGKLGREFASLLQEGSIELHEAYVVGKWLFDEPLFSHALRPDALSKNDSNLFSRSLLQVLQSSLLLLVGKSEQKVSLQAADTTIQVHSAPTLIREVQVLFQKLSSLSQQQLSWGDILVLAPDIEQYMPYIERVFGTAIPYQIVGVKTEESLTLFRFFWQMLELPRVGWTADALFSLFDCKAIQRKYDLEVEELAGVWACMKALKFHEAMALDSFVNHVVSLWTKSGDLEIDSSLGKALGICISFIRTVYDTLASPVFYEERSIGSWASFFENLFESHFQPDWSHTKEQRETALLKQAFVILKKSARQTPDKISFSKAKEHFRAAVAELVKKEETVIHAPLVFASIGAIRSYPAKIISLIGMNEGAFPRQEEPFEPRIDKYLFIEAVMSARNALYMSYQSYSFEEKAPLEPSVCVTDLLQTLDQCCRIDGKLPTKACYFSHSLDSPVRQQKKGVTPAAPAKNKIKPQNGAKDVSSRSKGSPGRGERRSLGKDELAGATGVTPFVFEKKPQEVQEAATVSFLQQVARSPLAPYFQKTLSLYLTQKERKLLSNVFENMEQKTLFRLRKEAFSLPANKALQLLEKETQILPTAIKRASISLFREEIASLQKAATRFGIHPEEGVTIELSASSHQVEEVKRGHFRLPPLSVSLTPTRQVQITGLLKDLYFQGQLFFGRRSEETLVRAWPKILLAAAIKKTFDLPLQNDAFFLKETKQVSFTIEDPLTELGHYVAYALECTTSASCLYPEWVPLFETVDVPPRESTDPYLNFYLLRTTSEDLLQKWPLWKKQASSLFENLRSAHGL